jgi:hypothetical protein
MWSKIRKVLGVITDALLIGRKAGWWSKKHGPSSNAPTPPDFDRPHRPGR